MKLVESLFDITYLSIVIALGVRLLLEEKKDAKLFGLMAVLLGFGDAFHLIPRITAHLTMDGFTKYVKALSYGQMVTSITMTIFYILFYYYYVSRTGKKNNTIKWSILILSLVRIVLTLMPQNNWGDKDGNFTFAILRNVPFLIMGIILIYLSYKERKVEGMKYMSLLVFLSFLFYIPVVLFSSTYPIVGALMMPKTVAYLLIVILGYRFFIKKGSIQNVSKLSLTFLIMGLVGGVFYREFTKVMGFAGKTQLSLIHVHTLLLGFIGLFLIYIALRLSGEALINEKVNKFSKVYVTGLTITLMTMIIKGMYQITSMGNNLINIKALEGISGIGHIVLAVGLFLTFKWTIGDFSKATTKVKTKLS